MPASVTSGKRTMWPPDEDFMEYLLRLRNTCVITAYLEKEEQLTGKTWYLSISTNTFVTIALFPQKEVGCEIFFQHQRTFVFT